ncbi:unnamed protein product [Anisakis simplex]|uniref:1-phosphatidylinositol 4-kinase n=1 Tax=Anisakis simplex TaxID=6269 RepID=A0A0M3JAR9_ANISI|nr:unnamed protein product [Anisakis simplex]
MTADLTAGLLFPFVTSQGFIVHNMSGTHIMDVKLPNKAGDTLGKIVHPTQVTLFKVLIANKAAHGGNYQVFKAGTDDPIIMVEKVRLYDIHCADHFTHLTPKYRYRCIQLQKWLDCWNVNAFIGLEGPIERF